jgi:hypothetical protein
MELTDTTKILQVIAFEHPCKENIKPQLVEYVTNFQGALLTGAVCVSADKQANTICCFLVVK